MQTEGESNKAAVMTSSTEAQSAELVDRHQPLAGVVKRKRTKRPRHQPPAWSSASSSESTTTEEEDMAHCLILLAQGGGVVVDSKPSSQPAAVIMPPTAQPPPAPVVVMVNNKSERYTSRKYTEAATSEDGVKAGFYVYECRTCNKCFPTFQALGGHRASHKKPRLLLLGTTTAADDDIINNVTTTKQQQQNNNKRPPPPTASPEVTTALSLNSHHHHVAAAAGISSKLRVHECSICGAEFASGQALGGHMRRHRPLNAPDRAVITTTMDAATNNGKKESIVNLELDLNLPAPLSDEEATAVSPSLPPPPVVLGLGQFNNGNKAGLMLTASALVDCHY